MAKNAKTVAKVAAKKTPSTRKAARAAAVIKKSTTVPAATTKGNGKDNGDSKGKPAATAKRSKPDVTTVDADWLYDAFMATLPHIDVDAKPPAVPGVWIKMRGGGQLIVRAGDDAASVLLTPTGAMVDAGKPFAALIGPWHLNQLVRRLRRHGRRPVKIGTATEQDGNTRFCVQLTAHDLYVMPCLSTTPADDDPDLAKIPSGDLTKKLIFDPDLLARFIEPADTFGDGTIQLIAADGPHVWVLVNQPQRAKVLGTITATH